MTIDIFDIVKYKPIWINEKFSHTYLLYLDFFKGTFRELTTQNFVITILLDIGASTYMSSMSYVCE